LLNIFYKSILCLSYIVYLKIIILLLNDYRAVGMLVIFVLLEKKFVIKKICYKKVHFVYDNSYTLLRIMLYPVSYRIMMPIFLLISGMLCHLLLDIIYCRYMVTVLLYIHLNKILFTLKKEQILELNSFQICFNIDVVSNLSWLLRLPRI
jgi:hypothetical protein